jgi:hypothetical protein
LILAFSARDHKIGAIHFRAVFSINAVVAAAKAFEMIGFIGWPLAKALPVAP